MPLLVLKASFEDISPSLSLSSPPSLSLSSVPSLSIFLLLALMRRTLLALREPKPNRLWWNIDYRYLLPCGQHASPIYPTLARSNGKMYDFRSQLDIVECIVGWSEDDFHVLISKLMALRTVSNNARADAFMQQYDIVRSSCFRDNVISALLCIWR